jgi:ParB-like chromosome segregation protein Spo0J
MSFMLVLMDDQAVLEEVDISTVGEKFAELRIIRPRQVLTMERSMMKYGQLSPVVCVRTGSGFEMIDGFKRLHACRRLRRRTLTARVLTITDRACKAAIIQLNKAGGSISDLEEAMVLRSLYRDDKLTQSEIAILVGRTKSWVSRRITLIERVADEVQQDIRLGLVSISVGREVARLPRGNQKEAAAAVIKHRFTSRETAKLVSYLLSRPSYAYPTILASPWEVVEPRERPAGLAARLLSFQRVSNAVLKALNESCRSDIVGSSGLIRQTIAVVMQTANELKIALEVNT